MVDFNKKTLAIIVSDIHIGHELSRIEEFKAFLSAILRKKTNNEIPFLRALIILGDLFDLNATSFEDLCSNNEYFGIYEIIKKLQKYNVEFILVLGNHEISTSWFYNLQFTERKNRFINQFKENSFLFNLLTEENLCQYLILISENKNIYLGLIDSKYDEPFKWIHLANKPFRKKATYFMAHGYQFEDKDTHHLITGWWDFGKNLSDAWKNYITDKWIKVKNTFGKRNYSRFYENIKKSYENENNPFSHIIFGHTHECDIKDSTILNTGCWLLDANPSFLEIYIDGTCNLYEIVL